MSSQSQRGYVLVSFPGAAYTHRCALQAAQAVLAPRGWTIHDGQPAGNDNASEAAKTDEDTETWLKVIRGDTATATPDPVLYFMDYDLVPFDSVHPARSSVAASTSSSASPAYSASASSYPIRKALIRKNWLHTGIHAHSVKSAPSDPAGTATRTRTALGYLPKSWSIDVQFADDLDELLIDDLYDLAEELEANDAREEDARKWYIIKAGMADRGMGIRMFSTLDGLREILEEFEGDSDDDDDEEEEEGEGGDEDAAVSKPSALSGNDTSVLLGQLRHFVIQEYIHPPLLLAPNSSNPTSFRKFHLRAYVLCVGGLSVYLWDEMLALFAPAAYQSPGGIGEEDSDESDGEASSHQPDPKVHLTNTCLHADGSAAADGRIAQDNVHLFSDLCRDEAPYRGRSASSSAHTAAETLTLTTSDLERVRALAAETVGRTFEGAAKGSGSTNWLMWENCWEVFGVDLMLGWEEKDQQEDSSQGATSSERDWRMWLLEVNAQPDFAQSGARLERTIEQMFEEALKLSVNSSENAQGGSGCESEKQSEAWGASDRPETSGRFRLCFGEKMRGGW